MTRKTRITERLTQALSPLFLSVENESHKHHVPEGSQTHFKVVAVSLKFEGLTRVARHRLVNHLLCDEMAQGLHALSMHLYTVDEWEKSNQAIIPSPDCKDGFDK